MIKFLKIAMCCFALMMVVSPAQAQDEPAPDQASAPLIDLSKYFGAGLIIIGAGLGIGKIGAAATDNIARQPEVAGNVQTAMIISAALIEGATFFGLIICMLF